ncbi:MAG: hypothetical protein AB1629_01285 [Candidatus Omnitrophota bacterium]
MKKVAIIVRSSDAEATVKHLRLLGLLHVEHQGEPKGKDIAALQEDLALVNSALNLFSKIGNTKESTKQQEKINTDWHKLALHSIDLEKRLKQLEMYAEKLQSTILEWQNWGDFQPEELKELAFKGIYASFYKITLKELDCFPKDAVVKIVYIKAGAAYVIVFSQQKLEIPFKEIAAPKDSLSDMHRRLGDDTKLIQSLKLQLYKMSRFYQDFLKIKNELDKEMELQQAINGMANFGTLSFIMGYVPADRVEGLIVKARSMQWGIVVKEPDDTDNVPVELRNPRWISIIRPIFKFLEILPGYRELDISLPFLIFFSIFFGILIGDAGYGLVYFMITFFLQQKLRKKNVAASNFYLFYLLSICAVIWGVLTGTFFGHEWLMKSGIKPLLPALTDDKVVQRFCLFLGALHLSLAHGWRAILKVPSLSALGDVGWVGILWAAFFIAKALVLGDVFPSYGLWLLIPGVILVILFTSPRKNLLKSAEEWASWFIALPLSFMSNFSDVISYIRLFAVGLAGIAIADAFNAMAAMVGSANKFSILASILIALIGNALAIVLGPVSVLVHGVRLNVLEFSGHAGISWSGIRYKPLKE